MNTINLTAPTWTDILGLIVEAVHKTTQEVPKAPDWRYLSHCPEGYDTVLGYMARHFPDHVGICAEAEDTLRDGFWLTHRCRERGLDAVRVSAPQCLQAQGIATVKAYPINLLRERMGA